MTNVAVKPTGLLELARTFSAGFGRFVRSIFLPRFSLRALLFLMALACGALTVWSLTVKPILRNKEAIAKLNNLGVLLTMEPIEGARWKSWFVRPNDAKYLVNVIGAKGFSRCPPKGFELLARFDRLRELDLSDGMFDDPTLGFLEHLHDLLRCAVDAPQQWYTSQDSINRSLYELFCT